MRVIALIFGVVIAAVGGVIAYRALFVHRSADFVVTSTGGVHEFQSGWKITLGIALLLVGAIVAFLAARRKRA